MDISIFRNILSSLKNLKKEKKTFELKSNYDIKGSRLFDVKKNHIKKYHRCVGWNQQSLHPIYPYATLTALHFDLVNHKDFPFSPYGLIHKKEVIKCYKPLREGKWQLTAHIQAIRPLKTGFEIDILTELKIHQELYWQSLTTAFKKTKNNQHQKKTFSILKQGKLINIPAKLPREYGLISMNIDPIHMSEVTARLMGHKKAILHGMWSLARGLCEFESLNYPLKVEAQFKSPIYSPSSIQIEKSGNSFAFYSEDGKTLHLSGELNNLHN